MRPLSFAHFHVSLLAAVISGCAHYQLPSSQLESSETLGKGRGEIMIVEFLSGTDLNGAPGITQPDPESGDSPEVRAPSSFAKPALSFRYGIKENVELGVRFQTYGPVSILGRWQLSGKPANQAASGDFSMAFTGRAGMLITQFGEGATTYLGFGGSLLGGYRIGARHLITLGPFVSLASLSNSPVVEQVGGQTSETSSYSAVSYGGALGYQREIMDLVLRGELTYSMGSRQEAKIKSVAAAASAGLRF